MIMKLGQELIEIKMGVVLSSMYEEVSFAKD